ncbi:hypothetical protein ACFRJ1_33865 [Streptomyces sp. NPDC056773]|uniref:hypothetical protein n=1 Tax=unclassified Streptomyces TaxID=2593676 RepID=UPI0020B6E96C|nr:hypothetical protein [Streptomyces sp. TBY4]MCP3760044.1 hypothetical protein [Streptomyces sp. TBY4]
MEVVAVRRGAVRSVVMAGLLVLLGGLGSGVGSARAGGGPEAEADVAYHGRVALTAGRLRILLVPENEGPSALANATVRLRLSADLADRQELAEGCARAGRREVVCETGELPLHGRGRHIGLALQLKEPVAEVVVRVDTWWNGGATDRNHANNDHVVLALDTGDTYAF